MNWAKAIGNFFDAAQVDMLSVSPQDFIDSIENALSGMNAETLGETNRMMNLLNVVQHTSADYLGLMEDHLEGRRIRFRYFRPFTEQRRRPASRGHLRWPGVTRWRSVGQCRRQGRAHTGR